MINNEIFVMEKNLNFYCASKYLHLSFYLPAGVSIQHECHRLMPLKLEHRSYIKEKRRHLHLHTAADSREPFEFSVVFCSRYLSVCLK